MVDAATRATRIGKNSIITITTAAMAMRSSRRKFTTLSFTTLVWSVMVKMVTSDGNVDLNSSITFSMSAPMAVMLRPFFISTLSTRHFCPLLVTYDDGWGYSRLILATSFRRTTLPDGSE